MLFHQMLFEQFGEFPNYDTGGDAYVQRMFGAKLWNFQTSVAHVHNTLLDPFYLVTKNDGVAVGE